MAKGNVVAGLSEQQYAEIELAVMETERGRTFLREYLARNRTADTRMLLDAISRLESALCLKAIEHEGGGEFTPALAEIASVVTATRTEIAAIRNDLIAGGGALAQGPDAFTHAAEQANSLSSDLLSQVEQVEDLAWKIRELGVDVEICDKLDVCVEELMALCWKQDVSGQRAAKALSVLQYVNDRTGGSLVSVGADTAADETKVGALAAPVAEPEAVNTDQDAYFADDAELFDENEKSAEQVRSSAPVPGLAYSEPVAEEQPRTVEDQLSSDDIVAEVTVPVEVVSPGETSESAEVAKAPETSEPEVAVAPEETPKANDPTTFAASDLIEKKSSEMIGPANMKGFTEMATSIDSTGPFSSTTLAQMVTPAEAAKPKVAAPAPVDPFNVELDKLAKRDGFTFKTEAPASADTAAEAKPETDASAADDENNGHIVIIRTPSEPDEKRLPEPVTQEKPDENGEVPMVVISPPTATTA